MNEDMPEFPQQGTIYLMQQGIPFALNAAIYM